MVIDASKGLQNGGMFQTQSRSIVPKLLRPWNTSEQIKQVELIFQEVRILQKLLIKQSNRYVTQSVNSYLPICIKMQQV